MMKKVIICLFAVLLPVISFGQGIRFEKGNFDQALAKAKAERKMVFVDAYAVWCGPCKWMAVNIFPDPEVGAYFDKYFVALKLDVERGEGPAIKTRYAIEGLPGYLFLDSDGNVVFRGTGSMSKEEFIALSEEARAVASDPNGVGRMAARYATERNNAHFVKEYLDKLKSSGAAGYYDVVEQYLKIQQGMTPESGEMVRFLDTHAHSLVFGGKADKILAEYLWSDAWDLYVRKDLRQRFQQLPDALAKQTTEYAVLTRDTALLDIAMERAEAYGLKLQEGQRERLLIYYYLQTGEGNKYKALIKPQIAAFYNSLDVADLQKKHKSFMQKMRNEPNRRGRSFAMRDSEKLRHMASEYARFMTSDEDKKDLLRWATRIYEILPTDLKNAAFYAKALYLCGGNREEAILIMHEVVEKGKQEKNFEGFTKDLEAMKSRGTVMLTF